MPALFKRSNGYYYAILTDEHGRRKWVTTKERTKSKAVDKLATLCNGEEVRKAPTPSFTQFVTEFNAYASSAFSHENCGVYTRAFNQFGKHVGSLALDLITARHIDSFKSLRLRAVKPVTVNIELRTLRSAFYTAKRWKLIENNPFSSIQLCRISDEVPTYLSPQDFMKLLGVAPHQWLRDIFVVAALTGLRRGEIINMKWNDVDLTRKLIRIQSHGTFRTKSGKIRILPMNPSVSNVLSRKKSEAKGEFVFENDGNMIQDRGLSRWFKRCVTRAKLDDKLHFHSLRHSFASWLVQQNVSLYEVQKLLGHSSMKITEIYSHLAPQQLHESVGRLSIEL